MKLNEIRLPGLQMKMFFSQDIERWCSHLVKSLE
jgi:hypothetical protein